MNVNSAIPALPTTVPTARQSPAFLCAIVIDSSLKGSWSEKPFPFRAAQHAAQCIKKASIAAIQSSLECLNCSVSVYWPAHPIRYLRELVYNIQTNRERVAGQQKGAVHDKCS